MCNYLSLPQFLEYLLNDMVLANIIATYNLVFLKRIRSVPGKSVLDVSSSAMMHPTDQISTV